MNFRHTVLLALIALIPTVGQASVGMCLDDGDVAVSIMTNDRGEILDLALTVGDSTILRYPEAITSIVALPLITLNFTAKKKGAREALALDISGKKGHLRFRGKSIALECEWS